MLNIPVIYFRTQNSQVKHVLILCQLNSSKSLSFKNRPFPNNYFYIYCHILWFSSFMESYSFHLKSVTYFYLLFIIFVSLVVTTFFILLLLYFTEFLIYIFTNTFAKKTNDSDHVLKMIYINLSIFAKTIFS